MSCCLVGTLSRLQTVLLPAVHQEAAAAFWPAGDEYLIRSTVRIQQQHLPASTHTHTHAVLIDGALVRPPWALTFPLVRSGILSGDRIWVNTCRQLETSPDQQVAIPCFSVNAEFLFACCHGNIAHTDTADWWSIFLFNDWLIIQVLFCSLKVSVFTLV